MKHGIRNIFQRPPFSGSCLNTADICLPCLFRYKIWPKGSLCDVHQELNDFLLSHYSFSVTYCYIASANTVKTNMQEATCFDIWENRFLYLGVVTGNLGYVGF